MERFTAQDLLVILAGAGLGGPFCGAAAKAALDGNTLQAIIGFAVGLPLLVMAAAFPFLKRNLSSNVRTRVTSGSIVSLLFLVFVTFIYVVGPSIYIHVAKPQQEHSYLATGPIDSDFEGRPLGFWWNTEYLEIEQQRGDSSLYIHWYSIRGKNLGPEEVALKEAYLISSIDSTRLDLQIIALPDGPISIKDASPIPASAGFQLQANFRSDNQSVPEREFLKTWDSFYVVVEANGEKIRHFVSRAVVHGLLDAHHPELSPHVTKRK